jgi:hypothetical protein
MIVIFGIGGWEIQVRQVVVQQAQKDADAEGEWGERSLYIPCIRPLSESYATFCCDSDLIYEETPPKTTISQPSKMFQI